MSKKLFIFGSVILLAGCSTQTFNCDISFSKDEGDNNTTIVSCGYPDFEFTCDTRTYVQIDNEYSCSAHDGKKYVVVDKEPEHERRCEKQMGISAIATYKYDDNYDIIGVECKCSDSSIPEDGKCISWSDYCARHGEGAVPSYLKDTGTCKCDNDYYMASDNSECIPEWMGGIGISLQPHELGIEVTAFTSNSVAPSLGMKVGDVISWVDQEEIKGMELLEIIEKIRGEIGSIVLIGIQEEEKFINHIPITRVKLIDY